MIDALKSFNEIVSFIDLLCLIITILSVIKCYSKGFVLSLLSTSKWLLAYVVTLILFPKIKSYLINVIDNENLLNVILGLSIFSLVIFIIQIVNKVISKAVKFVGLGNFDSLLGIFFGFIKGYIVCVCLFSIIDTVYNYNKWPINTDKSYAFPYMVKGSIYLLKVFPNEKNYQDSKRKIEDL